MKFSPGIFLLSLLSATASFSIAPSAQRETEPKGPPATANVESLKFRYMGPAAAGRIATVAGVPGDPTTYYLGSASGGIWKSTDGHYVRADFRRPARGRHRQYCGRGGRSENDLGWHR